jgi:uncharacterized protein (TIGR02118 family)
MYKAMIFVKRQAGLERAAFFQWLMQEHAALVRNLPGLRRYTVSTEADGEDGTFDAVLECWFDDDQSAEAALAGARGQAVTAALRQRTARVEQAVLEEHKYVSAAESARFKLVAALKRRTDLTRAQFKSWWLDDHAPQVVVFPELGRYQVNIADKGPERFVDGIAEVSFVDLPTLKRIITSSEVKNVQQDSQVHTNARYRLFVEEHPVIA